MLIKILYVIFATLVILDSSTTMYMYKELGARFKEINPVRKFIHNKIGVYPTGILITLLVILLAPIHDKINQWVYVITSIVLLYIVYNNLSVMKKEKIL